MFISLSISLSLSLSLYLSIYLSIYLSHTHTHTHTPFLYDYNISHSLSSPLYLSHSVHLRSLSLSLSFSLSLSLSPCLTGISCNDGFEDCMFCSGVDVDGIASSIITLFHGLGKAVGLQAMSDEVTASHFRKGSERGAGTLNIANSKISIPASYRSRNTEHGKQ